jgi:hypothetical protein
MFEKYWGFLDDPTKHHNVDPSAQYWHSMQQYALTETNDVGFYKEVFDASLVTQPYMNGLGKFMAKFQPDQPCSATIDIERGCHLDHGTAIFFEQGTRRCALCDTLFGLTDDEALWFTMYKWAEFQPWKCRPRQDPGLLYYPAEYTHILQKYWNVLNDPVTHPDCDETDHTKASMRYMSKHLESMDLSAREPQVDADAPEKSYRVAHIAALSRRSPIQDAADHWSPQGNAQEYPVVAEKVPEWMNTAAKVSTGNR